MCQATERCEVCSDKERARGDREVWKTMDDNTIGVKDGGQGIKTKFAFDHVLGNTSTNKQAGVSHSHPNSSIDRPIDPQTPFRATLYNLMGTCQLTFPGREVCGASQVYTSTAKGVVAAAMDGLNATVFAYGVTSSGKTYTMMVSPLPFKWFAGKTERQRSCTPKHQQRRQD